MLLPVTELLLFPISSHCVGVFGAVPTPVIGIARPPLPGAVAADVAVFGIGGDLLPVIVGPALTLTASFATDRLQRSKLRSLKGLLTIAATPFPHNSRCRTDAYEGAARKVSTEKWLTYFWLKIGSRHASDHPARFRNCCRVHTASPPMSSSTTTKPGELRSFYSGTDTL